MTKLAPMPETISLHVPFRIAKHGGRKEVQLPPDAPVPRTRVDNSMIKAIARAFRWKRMLERGESATIQDLAATEKINPSYLSRVLRLTLLAPEIVEAVLDGRQPPELQLDQLLTPFPVEWDFQRALFALPN